MKLVIVSASMRKDAQSLKVAAWLRDHATNKLSVDAEVLDLHKHRLPLFDVGETDAPAAVTILDALDSADGVVFVSPEWNGMMSHGLMNMLQFVDRQLAHKPVMLVGVSAGRGGSYPVMQMRTMGYKNNHYVISPENLLVQGVGEIMNDHDMEADGADGSVKKRADYALKILVAYAEALRGVRTSDVIDFESFPNGV